VCRERGDAAVARQMVAKDCESFHVFLERYRVEGQSRLERTNGPVCRKAADNSGTHKS
jgi:hypothetical protein